MALSALPTLTGVSVAPLWHVGYLVTTPYCWMGCSFCQLATPLPHASLSEAPRGLSIENLMHTDFGSIDYLKIRGGLSVKEPLDYWINLLRYIRLHCSAPIIAFSPVEVWQFHLREKRSLREILTSLQWAGADYLGAGGSEILIDEIRHDWSPYRMTSREWLQVIEAANAMGLASTASLMVYPGIPDELINQHAEQMAGLSIHHIELKPIRSQGTQWQMRGDAHLLEVAHALMKIRQGRPKLPIYVRLENPSTDALHILTACGADGFLTPRWEVSP